MSKPVQHTTDDEPCTGCQGSGFNGMTERRCACQPAVPARHFPASITVACCMSGTRETMQVAALGSFGVSFRYGAEASVIARGDDLVRMRAILDRQIGNWEAEHGKQS
jgi:hypothetical protein